MSELEPGEYVVTETEPVQSGYESTSFSVNGGGSQCGLSATVLVTAEAEAANAGGWYTEDGQVAKDADGYLTYTITEDQIAADGTIEVDCNPLAEYMEACMQARLNFASVGFKVRFVNESGEAIKYKDYSFDTVNWIPTGAKYTPSSNPSMLNTNDGADKYSAGYGWGEAWQRVYPMLSGSRIAGDVLDAEGFDGNGVRMIMAPLRCINPAIISFFKSNPGNDAGLIGSASVNSASCITLLQMNAFPELIKNSFTFNAYDGSSVTLNADPNRTYSDFLCAFYKVSSLDDLTATQKYNVLGTGNKGCSLGSSYSGQSGITTYYYNMRGDLTNWCIPYSKLDDGTLDYFKTWGFSSGRISEDKTLQSGGDVFDADKAAIYAYQPSYYLLESDPDVLAMGYEYLYDRCIRLTFDNTTRPISTGSDEHSASADVSGLKSYLDKSDAANANVLAAMNGGASISDGETLTLDNMEGFIEVPNAWDQLRYYDFGFKLEFEAVGYSGGAFQPAQVAFTNCYQIVPSAPVADGNPGAGDANPDNGGLTSEEAVKTDELGPLAFAGDLLRVAPWVALMAAASMALLVLADPNRRKLSRRRH